MTIAVNEIKQTLKPSFCSPYLNVCLQTCTSIKGLYDTGADISCVSEKYFRQLSPHCPPAKQRDEVAPKCKTAGCQPLTVRGRYEFHVRIGTKYLKHDFYISTLLPKNRSFAWEGQPNWGQGHLKVVTAITVPPLSAAFIKATVRTKGGAIPEGTLCIANVASYTHPLVTGGPYLVQPDNHGQITISVKICSLVDLEHDRNDFIGQVENVQDCETRKLNPAYLQAVAHQQQVAKPCQALNKPKRKFILETVKIQVQEQLQQQYLEVQLCHHKAISQDKFDFGRTDTLMHKITLKTQEPIYVKQFKISDAHCKEVERHVLEWLNLGVIQTARSRYNSPIFAVMKKDGKVRLVQDFRALNQQSYTDKYSMKDVSECIGEIG